MRRIGESNNGVLVEMTSQEYATLKEIQDAWGVHDDFPGGHVLLNSTQFHTAAAWVAVEGRIAQLEWLVGKLRDLVGTKRQSCK